MTELLQEMNESVAGSFVEESPETLITSNPGFFKAFSLVIATQVIMIRDWLEMIWLEM